MLSITQDIVSQSTIIIISLESIDIIMRNKTLSQIQKVISGFVQSSDILTCTDYIVKNASANTIITYWLADNQFNFFQPLVKLWNRKDKQSLYFGKLTELGEGAMPMLSEERQISDGKLLTRLEVTRITTTPPADTTLDVPAGYSKFNQQ
jgi:hypothetical protein